MSISELSPRHEPMAGLPDGMYLVVDTEHEMWRQAEAVESEVFMEKQYVETLDELSAEYAKYKDDTEMIATCVNGEVVGAIRFVHHNPETGFKTVNDIEAGRLHVTEDGKKILEAVDFSTVVEIGTIALKSEYRKHSNEETNALIFRMYGAIFNKANREGTPNVLASFDQGYLDGFAALFGPSVQILGPSEDYMGSKTAPVLMNVNEMMAYIRGQGMDELGDYIAASEYQVLDERVVAQDELHQTI